MRKKVRWLLAAAGALLLAGGMTAASFADPAVSSPDSGTLTPEQALLKAVSLIGKVKTAMGQSSVYEYEAWDMSNEIEEEFSEILDRAGVRVQWDSSVDADSSWASGMTAQGLLMNIPANLLVPGAEIQCYLTVEDADEDVTLPSDVESDMDAKVLNITLYVGAAGDAKKTSLIYPVRIEMDLPEGSRPGDPGDWLVLHYQGGRGSVIPAEVDEDHDRLIFEAYGFSNYAFIYGEYQKDIQIPTMKQKTVSDRSGSSLRISPPEGEWIRGETGWWYRCSNGTWPSAGWSIICTPIPTENRDICIPDGTKLTGNGITLIRTRRPESREHC